MAKDRQLIDDPERIRAVTHPLRLRLLDLLAEHRELTATECAELAGESVASCSFHLRQLEKYGCIERAAPRGREKPWKPVGEGGYATTIDPDLPGSVQATTELARLTFQHRAQALFEAVERLPEEPRSEEHTSELQSRGHLVCRLLLEKKKCKSQRCAGAARLQPGHR